MGVVINGLRIVKDVWKGEPMTIEGAIAELQNLIKADDVPFYYNGAIQKVIETIIDECNPKVGRWILEYLVSTNGDPYAVYRCNLCEWAEPTLLSRNYCPNCGSRMFERRADEINDRLLADM